MKITIIRALALVAVCAVQAELATKVPNEVGSVNHYLDKKIPTQELKEHNRQKRATCRINDCMSFVKNEAIQVYA
ncbi:hypothetical protein M5D96_010892 [Drosophila gunungcola]|uniref:Uncharacterized protein n=1 Tax=Drosophila gunungcola TaxID=103775 RepID=A0A9P9YGU2_9MUSC|nr:hypothetical protein M5D96_010892 [Drosophila gunungcola]